MLQTFAYNLFNSILKALISSSKIGKRYNRFWRVDFKMERQELVEIFVCAGVIRKGRNDRVCKNFTYQFACLLFLVIR